MLKDVLFSALVTIVVVLLAAIVGPKGPGSGRARFARREPEARLAVLVVVRSSFTQPASAETFIILGLPVVLLGALFLVPFVSNRGERAPSRRPVAVLAVVVLFTILAAHVLRAHRAMVAADERLEWRPDSGTMV